MELPPFASLYSGGSCDMEYTVLGPDQHVTITHLDSPPMDHYRTSDQCPDAYPELDDQQDSEVSSTTKTLSPNSASEMYFIGPKSTVNMETVMEKSKVLWNGRGRRTTDGRSGKTRRRVPNATQRKAANVRERKRMLNLNQAFDNLRECIPTFAYEKHLSRIDTLRLAMGYIRFMSDIIECPKPEIYEKYANAAEEMKAKWSAKV